MRKSLRRARRFAEALDKPAETPEGLDLYLFAGDAVATRSRLAVDPDTGALSVAATGPGDSVVPRSSALLDERVGSSWSPELVTPISWKQVVFLFSDHLGLTTDPGFTDNVLYLLLEDPRR